MRHANTRALANYWETIRRGRIAPLRTDVSPGDLSSLLSHLFILQRVDSDHALFRLAGTGLCELYRREFRDHNFLSMWNGADRAHMKAMLAAASQSPAPTGALAEAETIDGVKVEAEILLAPLMSPASRLDRFLGLFQPLAPTESLRGRPLVNQRLMTVYPPSARVAVHKPAPAASQMPPMPQQNGGRPHLRLVADNETSQPA